MQNAEIFEGDHVASKIVEAALRFYARHQYLTKEQQESTVLLADLIKQNRTKGGVTV